MRFKEIISERGRNQGSFDGEEMPAPSATPAQTPDWLKKIGSAIGIKQQAPAELKNAPPGFSIDPIQRQRAGYNPATQQEIAAYSKANPAVVQGLSTRDYSSSDPNATIPVVAGGMKDVEQAAKAVAPSRRADFDANAEIGEPDTPATNPMGQDPAQRAAAAAKPAAAPQAAGPKAADAEPEQLGYTPAQLAAADAASQKPVTDTGVGNTPLSSQ